MKSYIIGIDISMSDTGLFRLHVGSQAGLAFSVTSKPKVEIDIDERLDKIAHEVAMWVWNYTTKNRQVDLIVIEAISLGSRSPSQMERAGLHFMVRQKLRAMGIKFITVPPLTLKKFTSDSGKAEKSLMMKEVFKRYGEDLNNDNQADACALAYFGLAWLGKYRMDKEQKVVMKKYMTPKAPKKKKAKE